MHNSETHFANERYFSLPRYKIYYTSLPYDLAHRGTTILIKETIEHYQLLKYDQDTIQVTSIEVKEF
jgi:hypothetical protein